MRATSVLTARRCVGCIWGTTRRLSFLLRQGVCKQAARAREQDERDMATTTAAGTGRRPGYCGGEPAVLARPVTIVHSDIVSSTELVEAAGPRYPQLLARHRALIGAAVERGGGRFLAHAGDGTLALFDDPRDAVAAAVDAQRALGGELWPGGLAIRVRMGVHAGDVYDLDGEPVGLAVNLGARIMAEAAGGQVVVSGAVARAVAGEHGPRLADAGWHQIRNHAGPVHLHQVVADGLTVVVPRRPTGAPLLGVA
jgi:class 3 adenylate cyclase